MVLVTVGINVGYIPRSYYELINVYTEDQLRHEPYVIVTDSIRIKAGL